jgi:hypothetical protein
MKIAGAKKPRRKRNPNAKPKAQVTIATREGTECSDRRKKELWDLVSSIVLGQRPAQERPVAQQPASVSIVRWTTRSPSPSTAAV